jgi:outer membrane protein assembly factor BamB
VRGLVLLLVAALVAATVASGATTPPKLKPHKPVTLHPKPAPNLKLTRTPALPASHGAPTDATWLSYGANDQLTNAVASAEIDAAQAHSLVLRWAAPLDSWMAASPVAASVDGTLVVYAATEGGSVDAFVAATGKLLWTQDVGVVKAANDCGTWGVSSTPAIDVLRGLIYVVGASGYLHAFDLATGAEAAGYPLALTAERNSVEYVWGGLRIAGDQLLAVVASYCDARDAAGRAAEGRLVAVDLTTRTIVAQWDPVAGDANLGGMWGYGGVSIEPDGSALYTGVGNADVKSADGRPQDDAGYGDKIVKLDLRTFDVLAANLPAGILTTGADEDFGAAPVLFQPAGCPPLAAMNNKQGYLYVWDRTAIAAGPLMTLGVSDGAAPFVGAPAWSDEASMLFDAEAKGPAGDAGVVGIRISSDCKPHTVWRTSTGVGPQPPPIVVNDVVVAAGGSSGITVLQASDGLPLWHATTASPALAPPIEVAGTIYASGGERLLALSPRP